MHPAMQRQPWSAKRPSLRRGTGCVPPHTSHRSAPVSLLSSIPMRRSQDGSTVVLLSARAEARAGVDRDRKGVVGAEDRDLTALVLVVAAIFFVLLAREGSEPMEPGCPVGEVAPQGEQVRR